MTRDPSTAIEAGEGHVGGTHRVGRVDAPSSESEIATPGRSLLWRILTWDGAMAWGIAAIGAAMAWVGAVGPVRLDVFAALIPAVGAGYRWIAGRRQIAEACGGATPISRLIPLAIALFALCVFEALAFLANFMAKVDAGIATCLPIVLAAYLMLIALAIRPARGRGEGRMGP